MTDFLKCLICNSDTSHSYYGAVCCDPCRMFFRRQVLNPKVLQCTSRGICVLTLKARKKCFSCRFQKCLTVGMKPEMVNIDIHVSRRKQVRRLAQKSIGQEQTNLHAKSSNLLNLSSVQQVVNNICKLPKEDHQKILYKKVKAQNSLFRSSFQEKSLHIFHRNETSDGESKSSDEKAPIIGSWKHNELVAVSYSPPVSSPIICSRKPVLWIKELWSSPIPEELLPFQVVDTCFQAGQSIKSKLNIYLDPSSDADHQFLQSLMIPSLKKSQNLFWASDSTSLYLSSTNILVTFHREASSIFNVHVTSISKKESSIIIMESLNNDHWIRLKDLISFATIFQQFTHLDHELTTNAYSSDQLFQNSDEPRYTCILYMSVDRGCDVVSKAIESLSFFSKLSIEDQFIILKDSFILICCLMYNHKYDNETESYVTTALNGKLSYCIHKDRLKLQSANEYAEKLDQFYNSFRDKFFEFLRTDFLLISILSILCVLQENLGLACTDLLETERKYYCEILDAYIKAKVISNEWLSDIDAIWRNIHETFYQVSKYPTIFKQYAKEQERIKSNS